MNLLFAFPKDYIMKSFVATGGSFFLICIIVLVVLNYIRKKLLFRLEVQRKESEFQKQLLRVSIISQEQERRVLGKDLHSDIGSVLGLSNMYLEELFEQSDRKNQMFLQLRKMHTHVIEKVISISQQMTPVAIELVGLKSTLNELMGILTARNRVKTSVYFHNEELKLKTEQNLILYRVIKETVTNIITHSEASFVHLVQYILADKFIIEVRHDGEGLDQAGFEHHMKQPKGMGLKNISSRLQSLNGHIKFEKQEDLNTTFIIIPVKLERLQVV